MRTRGFTLLEVLVATLIMGLAVVGLLSAISTSMRNAARLTDYDRVAMVARPRVSVRDAPEPRARNGHSRAHRARGVVDGR